MEVVLRQIYRTIFFVSLTALGGCAKTKTAETVFPKATDQCQDQAYQGRFIARWVTGEVTLIEGIDREQILRDFVEPNLSALDHVEHDTRIVLDDQLGAAAAGNLPASMLSEINNWAAVRIDAGAAWASGHKGAGVTVAVIDSGVDITHDQLAQRVAYNKGESGVDSQGRDKSTNGFDDDQNGLIDDYAGFDFTNNSPQVRDYGSHGTHVAGMIAAEHYDTQAGPAEHAQGVAPEAKILPLAFIDSTGSGSLYNAMRAIDYASKRGVQIMNASWGGTSCSSLMRDQVTGLYQKGQILVVAAGNSGNNIDYFPEYPAAFNLFAQITVGATGTFDSRANFSNYGDRGVHIFAPGVDIVSTIPGNTHGTMSGTSMATPIVAGALAVLKGARPEANVDQLRDVIYRSAQYDSAYRNASRGRLNLGAALRLLSQ